ncbi:PilZ domain-containing protein [Undibacterium parvum]|uniref:PilZ domain-containing protein n=2 Tax=Undibacterium TaxID=401469 RepID=A0A6M4A161_9BURK|nr:PilZ domain-containing protein [Undibacterium parvum]AZP14170.1 PilZ domain-containing protein [Undibacterium parvum]QJQ05096.1 PilZ domain-containing protein [Undibacterium piscinae]
MLKQLFAKALGNEDDKPVPSDLHAHTDDKHLWLSSLIDLFPIGKKQRYYPEYKMDIVFDTLVIAYCVNGHFLYSASAIENDAEGHPAFFRITQSGERIAFSKVKSFQLVVPDTSESEVKLDYERRAALGRGRQFAKGNSISLISAAPGRGVSTVDTEVTKLVVQKDGPYAPATLILLTPDLDTLVVTDQRAKARVKISVPLMLSSEEGPLVSACTIVDISDAALRIHIDSNHPNMPEMEINSEVVMVINLSKAELQFSVKGKVMRSFPGIRVIKLLALLKNGKYVPFSPLDHLELKAGLMNF